MINRSVLGCQVELKIELKIAQGGLGSCGDTQERRKFDRRPLLQVLIFLVDNLKGISEAIEAVFSQAEVQKCIVHLIRNSLRHVSWKEREAMAKDLRFICEAAAEE
jgi:transposase-like protein